MPRHSDFLFFGVMHATHWQHLEADPRSASLHKIGQQRVAVIGALFILIGRTFIDPLSQDALVSHTCCHGGPPAKVPTTRPR